MQIYQPWYAVWSIDSVIMMTEKKRMRYSSAEITRYDFTCIYVSFIEYMFILYAVWFRNLYRDHHINSSLPEI